MRYVLHKFCGHQLLHSVKVRDEGTGMPDEQNFTTHLLSVKDAVEKAGWLEGEVIHKAWKLWQSTVAIQADLRAREDLQPSDRVQEVPQNSSAKPGVVFIVSSVTSVANVLFYIDSSPHLRRSRSQ
jgi:hypothetical protein